jgi:hypothetical protein
MEIQSWNERERIGVEAAIGTRLANLERFAAVVADGLYAHVARTDL